MSELVKECHHGRLTRQCRECDMEKEICELQDQLTTVTKQRDDLLNALSDIHKEAVDYQSRTGKPVTWCLKIGKILSTIKEQKDAE